MKRRLLQPPSLPVSGTGCFKSFSHTMEVIKREDCNFLPSALGLAAQGIDGGRDTPAGPDSLLSWAWDVSLAVLWLELNGISISRSETWEMVPIRKCQPPLTFYSFIIHRASVLCTLYLYLLIISHIS